MEQVGRALHSFSTRGENRLIATNNLTNTGMITHLFGGPSSSERVIEERNSRTLNLLELAAPNRSIGEHRERYSSILAEAISGVSNVA